MLNRKEVEEAVKNIESIVPWLKTMSSKKESNSVLVLKSIAELYLSASENIPEKEYCSSIKSHIVHQPSIECKECAYFEGQNAAIDLCTPLVMRLQGKMEELENKFKEVFEYAEHDDDCICGQFRHGRPTEDGGYETLYGYGSNEKWYQRGERPKCTCGLDELGSHQ